MTREIQPLLRSHVRWCHLQLHLCRHVHEDALPYIYVDTSTKTHFPVPNRSGFEWTAEFDVKPRPGSTVDNYPVVFTDFTTSDQATLVEVPLDDIPPATKRRFTRWFKLQ